MPRPPKNYDEIVRSTVPEPDSSFRPTEQQLEDTRAGRLAHDADERALLAAVEAALAGFPGIVPTVERRRVTLSGSVADAATMQRVLDRIGQISGIELDDRLFIEAPRKP